MEPNRLLQPGLAIQASQPQNALAPQPTWADAYDYNARAYTDWVARERAKGVELGTLDPQTGWPTKAGYLDAFGQYTNALLMGSTRPGIKAYHGSPHSFDRFDTSRIGTGEGAQAYGHGLYFAEKEGAAQSYRDTLGTRSMDLTDPGNLAAWMYHKNMGNRADAITELESAQIAQRNYPKSYKPGDAERTATALEKLRSGAEMPSAPGSMYEVNIRTNPEHMLHWDKPLSEQSEYVRGRISGRTDWTTPDMPGSRFYGEMMNRAKRDPVAAAHQLNDMGIPGIRYLDQGSRGAGEGSHNLVVFDDATIEILRKYGLAGLMAGGGAAAGSQGQ